MLRKLCILFLIFVAVLDADSLRKVTVQLQWKHQFEFAGFYAAKEKGYYKEVGLDVELREFSQTEGILKPVLDKEATYGVGYSSLIADYCNGKEIVLLANFFKHSPLVLVAQKSIKTPADLRGKKIMGISDGIDAITLINMLSKFGLKSSDYTSLETDFALEKFLNKDIDAMSVFTTNEIYRLDKLGVEYNVFNPAVFGQEYYDCNLFTSKEEALLHPKETQLFVEATLKGWEYALDHKEEISELILKYYNTQNKTKEALLFEAEQIESVMLRKVYKIGSIDPVRLNMIADEFRQNGFINSPEPCPVDGFVLQQSGDYASLITLKEFVKKLSPYALEIMALLSIGLVLVVWRNHIVKKLNLELQEKMRLTLEEAREKDKMLFHQNKLASMGEMMQNIAHQWRQPLSEVNSAVIVIDDILESRGVKDSVLEAKLFEIENLTNYMSKTISDFKEFHNPAKYKKLFVLQELIRESIIIVQGTLKDKEIELIFEDTHATKHYTYKNELQQVIVIILNNAIDAFESNNSLCKGVKKSISISIDEYDGLSHISICDNAGGVDVAIQEKIFEPYFTTKHMAQGTGLGLYIAKTIIEESVKGRLTQTNRNGGACFCIELKGY